MNAGKKNFNGWVWCPSKSFPGKYYYFNVFNGQAAWTLNELEESVMLKGMLQRADKWHSYPEPDTPPMDNWPYRGPQGFRGPHQASPMFGQAVFPKYSSGLENSRPLQMWSPPRQMGPISSQMGPMSSQMAQMSSQMAQMSSQMPMSSHMSMPTATIPTMGPMYPAYPDVPNVNSQFLPQEPSFPCQPKGPVWFDKGQKNSQNMFANSYNDYPNNWAGFDGQRQPARNAFAIKPVNQRVVEANRFDPMYKYSQRDERQKLFNQQLKGQFQQDPMFEQPAANQPRDIFKLKRTVNFGPSNAIDKEPMIKRTRTFFDGPIVENQRLYMAKPTESSSNKDLGLLDMNRRDPNFSETQFFTQKKGSQIKSQLNRPLSKSSESLLFYEDPPKSDAFLSSQLNTVFPKPETPQALLQNPFLDHKLASKSYENLSSLNTHGLSPPIPLKRNKPSSDTLSKIDEKPEINIGRINPNIIGSKSFDNLTLLDDNTPMGNQGLPLLMQRTKTSNNIKVPTNRIDVKTAEDTKDALDQSDLRYTLLAKKKRSMSVDNPEPVPSKKIRTSYTNETKPEPCKKRVTFNLRANDDGTEEDGYGEVDEMDTVLTQFNVGKVEEMDVPDTSLPNHTLANLKRLGSQASTDQWYIVVDAGVLLEDYDFLVQFVTDDPLCTVVVPEAARRWLEALSRGAARGRPLAAAARHLARKLASPPHNVLFQDPSAEDADLPLPASVLDCCEMMVRAGHHAVLFTNDPELYQTASEAELYAFMVQDIKDSVIAEKPEVTFQLKKLQSDIKDTETLNDSKKMVHEKSLVREKDLFPVNCYRKRLFDDSRIELNNQTVQSGENKHTAIQKNTVTSTLEGHTFPPKIYKESEESSDLTLSSEVRKEIQKLNLKENPRTLEIQKNDSLKKASINFAKTREPPKQSANEKEHLFENQIKPEKENIKKEIANTFEISSWIRKIKRVNAYTIEAQLKKFRMKNETVEEVISMRMEEWMCYFTQILEDSLTEILQKSHDPTRFNQPPVSLVDTIERVVEAFEEENSVVSMLAARLIGMMPETHGGKAKAAVQPSDFMKMLGCGILLIKCLNLILCHSELSQAEESLLDLLQAIEEPVGRDDCPPVPAVGRDDPPDLDYQERRNFVKEPIEVIEYLKKHFPEWRDYSGTPQDYCQEYPKKIVRTCGRDINLVTIDHTKSITVKTSNETIPNTSKDNTKDTNENNIATDKNSKELVKNDKHEPKSLKTLTVTSFGQNKDPVMREIDIEKRETVNKEMEDMILDITGPKSITKFYDLNSVIINKETNIVSDKKHDEIAKNTEKTELEILRTIKDIDTVSTNNTDAKENENYYNAKENETAKHMEKSEPKIVRTIKNIDSVLTDNSDAKKDDMSKNIDKTERKIVRTIKNIDTVPINNTDAKENSKLDSDVAVGCSFGETKIDGQKIRRNIVFIDEFEKKIAKAIENEKANIVNEMEGLNMENCNGKYEGNVNDTNNMNEINDEETETFDLDALDYSAMEYDSEYNSSLTFTDYYLSDLALNDSEMKNDDCVDSNEPQNDIKDHIDDSVAQNQAQNKDTVTPNLSNFEVQTQNKDSAGQSPDQNNIEAENKQSAGQNNPDQKIFEAQSKHIFLQKNENVPKNDNEHSENNPKDLQNDVKYLKNNNEAEINDGGKNSDVRSRNDGQSKEGSNQPLAYTRLKIFFTVLCECLVKTCEFVERNLCQCNYLATEDRRISMSEKVLKLQSHYGAVVDKLELIIARESVDQTAVYREVQSNPQAAGDAIAINHRQVIKKCVEQAKIIMAELNVLISLIDGDFDVSTASDSGCSVILPYK